MLTATASEFKYDLSTSTVKSGEITITIVNSGTIEHEFLVYKKSDIAKVLEDVAGKKVEPDPIIAEIEEDELPVKAVKTVKVTLAPGVYEIACHLPNHYENGMKATLNVQ